MARKRKTMVKRTLSEAELAARRANAKKSTGPKNTERTRFNGVRHGMRGAAVLPGESQEAYDERLERWMGDHGPENDSQRFQIQRAVELSFKIERGDRVEEALALDQMKRVVDAAKGSQAEVEQLAANLAEQPAASLRGLRKSSAGCLWLLSAWGILLQALQRRKRLLGSERSRVLSLLGKDRSDVLQGDPLAIRWFASLMAAGFPPKCDLVEVIITELKYDSPKINPTELKCRAEEVAADAPTKAEGCVRLQTYIAETTAELKQQLEIVRELEAERQSIQLQKARIDLTVEGKQLLQYQKTHDAGLHRALRRFDAMKNPRIPKPVGRPRKTQAEVVTTETIAADTTGPVTDVPTPNPSSTTAEAMTEAAKNPGAATTEAKTGAPAEDSVAATTEATTGAPAENPGAATTEAKTDAAVENPSAVTTEAKTDFPAENPSAATTEAKMEVSIFAQTATTVEPVVALPKSGP